MKTTSVLSSSLLNLSVKKSLPLAGFPRKSRQLDTPTPTTHEVPAGGVTVATGSGGLGSRVSKVKWEPRKETSRVTPHQQ